MTLGMITEVYFGMLYQLIFATFTNTYIGAIFYLFNYLNDWI